MQITEEYLTRQDVANLLKCGIRKIDRLDIPRLKIGRIVRFRKSDVIGLLNKYLEEKPNAENHCEQPE